MTKLKLTIVEEFQKMADLTAPKCASACFAPHQCCSPEHCDLTMQYARDEWGVALERTSHERLPLMGESGCTAAPHLRPICTVHICERVYMTDQNFAKMYFDLRERLNALLAKKEKQDSRGRR